MKVFTVSEAPREDGDQSRFTASSSSEVTLNLIYQGFQKYEVLIFMEFAYFLVLLNVQKATSLTEECHRKSDNEAGL